MGIAPLATSLVPLPGKPVPGTLDAQSPFDHGLVDELGKLQDVGQTPFTVVVAEQMRPHSRPLAEVAEGFHEGTPLPALVGLAEAIDEVHHRVQAQVQAVARTVALQAPALLQLHDLACGNVDQPGRQGRAHGHGVAGRRHRHQQ